MRGGSVPTGRGGGGPRFGYPLSENDPKTPFLTLDNDWTTWQYDWTIFGETLRGLARWGSAGLT